MLTLIHLSKLILPSHPYPQSQAPTQGCLHHLLNGPSSISLGIMSLILPFPCPRSSCPHHFHLPEVLSSSKAQPASHLLRGTFPGHSSERPSPSPNTHGWTHSALGCGHISAFKNLNVSVISILASHNALRLVCGINKRKGQGEGQNEMEDGVR